MSLPVDFYHPQTMLLQRLDKYLATGWFRNNRMLFRTEILCLEGSIFPVINIRLPLKGYQPTKRQRKLIRTNDQRFRIVIEPLNLQPAHNLLYEAHKKRFKGFLYGSLQEFFFGEINWKKELFNTFQLCIYDGATIVAVSFFDLGKKSVASLLALYQEAYQSHSLGFYTMLKEVEFAQKIDVEYFYPGYILGENSTFDYKIRLGEMEYYDWKDHWKPLKRLQLNDFLGFEVLKALEAVEQALRQAGIAFQRLLYPPFPMGFLYHDNHYVRSPALIKLRQMEDNDFICIEYLIDRRLYQVAQVGAWVRFEEMAQVGVTEDYTDPEVYLLDLMVYQEVFNQFRNAESLVHWLRSMLDYWGEAK